MKKKLITGLLVVVMLLAIVPFATASPRFKDVEQHWAANDIATAVDAGYVKGYPDNTFQPNGKITRAEFVAMINNALGASEVSNTLFTDVSKNDWFYSDVQKAVFACYIRGYEDNTFRPSNFISREEAATIVSRIVPVAGKLGSAGAEFTDKYAIAAWAAPAAGAIAEKGYIKGYPDGSFLPQGNLTRSEAVSIINRIIAGENIVDGKTTLKADQDKLASGIYLGGVQVAKSVANGSVFVDNSMILSTTQLLGGGSHSVDFNNSFVAVMNANKEGSEPLNIKMSGNTTIQRLNIFSNTIITAKDLVGAGVVDAYVTGDSVKQVVVDGPITNLVVDKACTIIVKAGGSIEQITINVDGVELIIEKGGYVGTVISNANTKLKDKTAVKHLVVNNGSDNTYQTEPGKITINDGTAKLENSSGGNTTGGGGSTGGGGGGGGGGTNPPATNYLDAPTNFVFVNAQGEYTLGWNAVVDAGSYTMVIKNGTTTVKTITGVPGEAASEILLDASKNPYVDFDAAIGALPKTATNYSVTVTALPGAGVTKTAKDSAVQTVKLLAAPVVALADKDALATAKLVWPAVADAASYKLSSTDPATDQTTDKLEVALSGILASSSTGEYTFKVDALPAAGATMTMGNSETVKINYLTSKTQITGLKMEKTKDAYAMVWNNVDGNNGYVLHNGLDVTNKANSVAVAKDVVTATIPASWYVNGTLSMVVKPANQVGSADAWTIGGGAIQASDAVGVIVPAAPAPVIADATVPTTISWDQVSYADNGYEVEILNTATNAVIAATAKITAKTENAKTIYSIDLAEQFKTIAVGNYQVQVRVKDRTTVSGTQNYILPSAWATAKATLGGAEQNYVVGTLDAPGDFQVAQKTSANQDLLNWADVTTCMAGTTPITGLTGITYEYALNPVDPAAIKGTAVAASEVALDNLKGNNAVYARAVSTNPLLHASAWSKVNLNRLDAPKLSLAETVPDYKNLSGYSSKVELTLAAVANATSYTLKDGNNELLTGGAAGAVDLTNTFKTAGAALTKNYTYGAFGSLATTVVGADGNLYLDSSVSTQDIKRLAKPVNIKIAPDYAAVVAPFNGDHTKLGAAARTYVASWDAADANYGYIVKATDLAETATIAAGTHSWTLPTNWRNTLKTYNNVLLGANGNVDEFILSSYPAMISGNTATQTIYTKPVLTAPTQSATGYTVTIPTLTDVDLYNLMVTYTSPSGVVTDVTPTNAQTLDKSQDSMDVYLGNTINNNNGQYDVYVRSADAISGNMAVIGSDWSPALTITNNRLAAPVLSMTTTLDANLKEKVVLNWQDNNTNTNVLTNTYDVYVDDTLVARGISERFYDITSNVATGGHTVYVIAHTSDFGYLASEKPATLQTITRQAAPTIAVADGEKTILTVAGAGATPASYSAIVNDGTANAVQALTAGTDNVTADVTETFNKEVEITRTYSVVVLGDDAQFLLPSAMTTQTITRAAIPSGLVLKNTAGAYSIGWNETTNNGFKVFYNKNEKPDAIIAKDIYTSAVPNTDAWLNSADVHPIQVRTCGDLANGLLDSKNSDVLQVTSSPAPTNVVLTKAGKLTWTGSDALKYTVTSLVKEGSATNLITSPVVDLQTAKTKGEHDFVDLIKANGSGNYVATIQAQENLDATINRLGSVLVTATQDCTIANAPVVGVGGITNPTIDATNVSFSLPTDNYTQSFSVTVNGGTAKTVAATTPTTTLAIALTDFATPGLYPIVITPIAKEGSISGSAVSFNVEKLTAPTVEVRQGSVYLYWKAANATDAVENYVIKNNDDATKAYVVKACGENLVAGTGYFCVEITADCDVAGSSPSYTVTRTNGTDTDQDVSFTLSSDGKVKSIIRLADVTATSLELTEAVGATGYEYNLSWAAITNATGYTVNDTVVTEAKTAITPAAAGSSQILALKATGTTDNAADTYYLGSKTATNATIYTLADFTGLTYTPDLYLASWDKVDHATAYEFRVMKFTAPDTYEATKFTNANSKDYIEYLNVLVDEIKAKGELHADYSIQMRAIGATTGNELVVPSAWQEITKVNTGDIHETSFTVTDDAGAAVNGATVEVTTVDGQTVIATAAADSNVVKLNLPAGTYDAGNIVVTAKGHDTNSAATVEVGTGKANAAAVTLQRTKYAVNLTIVNADGTDFDTLNAGATLDGATTLTGFAMVDPATYKIADLELLPGEHTYAIANATYTTEGYPYLDIATTTFTVSDTEANDVAVKLVKKSYNAKFTIQDAGNALLNNATLAINGPTTTSITVANGAADVQLLPGEYTLDATLKDYKAVKGQKFTMGKADMTVANEQSTITLSTVDDATITLNVKSGTTPVKGVEVSLFADGNTTEALQTITTDDAGVAKFTGLNSGNYQYRVNASGTGYNNKALTQVVLVKEGVSQDVELTVPFKVHVYSGTTPNIQGATFSATPTINPEDCYQLTNLYTLNLAAGDYKDFVVTGPTAGKYNASTAETLTVAANALVKDVELKGAVAFSANKAGVTFTVTDASGRPVAKGETCSTAPYQVSLNVPDGHFTYKATLADHVTVTGDFNVEKAVANKIVPEAIMTLVEPTLHETVFTITDDVKAPVYGAKVEVTTADGTIVSNTAAADSNVVKLRLVAGDYVAGKIVVTAKGHDANSAVAVEVGTGKANAANVTLQRIKYPVNFTIVNEDGTNFDTLNARATLDGAATFRGFSPIDEKTYKIDGLELLPGEHTYAIANATYTTEGYHYLDIATTTFTVSATETNNVAVKLVKQSYIAKFTIQDSANRVLNGAELTINGPKTTTIKVENGAAVVKLSPGAYTLDATLAGYKAVKGQAFTMTNADMTAITPESTITMTSDVGNATISLNVKSGTTPVEGAVVSLFAATDTTKALKTITTGVDGVAAFTGLNSGTYKYSVDASGTGYNNKALTQVVLANTGVSENVELTVPFKVHVYSGTTPSIEGATFSATPTINSGDCSYLTDLYTLNLAAGNYKDFVVRAGKYNASTSETLTVAAKAATKEVELKGAVTFSANKAGVTFTVKDASNKQVATGVTTGTAAPYTVSLNLPDGKCSYEATLADHVTFTGDFDVVKGASTNAPSQITMIPNTANLYNAVFTVATAPTNDIVITIDGLTTATITAGTKTSNTVQLTEGGHSYTVAATTGYEAVAKTNITIATNNSNSFEVALQAKNVPTKAVLFKVIRGDALVSGATVTLTDGASNFTLNAVTGSDGYYSADVPAGSYTYSVVSTGNQTQTGTLDITTATSPIVKEVDLGIPYNIKVTASGSPVSGATVNAGGTTATTNVDGIAEFQLAKGDHNVTVDGASYATGSATVKVGTTTATTVVDLLSGDVNLNFSISSKNTQDLLVDLSKIVLNVDCQTGPTAVGTDGVALLSGLANGYHSYTATLKGYSTINGSFLVEDGAITQGADVSMSSSVVTNYSVTFALDGAYTGNVDLIVDGVTHTNYDFTTPISLGSGYHAVKVEATADHEAFELGFTVSQAATVNLTVNAAPTNVDLTVLVKDRAASKASGNLVLLDGADVTVNYKTITSANGEAVFTGLNPSQYYTVNISLAGYNSYLDAIKTSTGNSQRTVSLTKSTPTPPTPEKADSIFNLSAADAGGTLTLVRVKDGQTFSATALGTVIAFSGLEVGKYLYLYTPAGAYTTNTDWQSVEVNGNTQTKITLTAKH